MTTGTSRLDALSPEMRALLAMRLKQKKAASAQGIELLQRQQGVSKFPMSYSQQRVMFFEELIKGTSRFHIGSGYRLTGELDVQALRNALNDIVRRHESLRAYANFETDEYMQMVLPELELELPVIDLEGKIPVDDQDALFEYLDPYAHEPFKLYEGPLVRATLFRLSPQSHILLWMTHHLINDGWSVDIFEQELPLFYEAHRTQQPASLPELPVQYADYSAWQQAWMKSEDCERQLKYWLNQLGGPLPALDLPLDFPRPSYREKLNNDYVPITIPEKLADSLRALSKRSKCTLFTTLMSAYQLMLSCYSGNRDIIVLTPIAGRNRPEIEKLIGYFANTLAIRTRIDLNASFENLLLQVKETLLDANDHQDLPFDRIVEVLNPDRDMSHSAVASTMFLLERHGMGDMNTPTLRIEQLTSETVRGGLLDVTLAMIDHDVGAISGTLTYYASLFRKSTIQRMRDHFLVMLERIVESPGLPLYQIMAVPQQEQAEVIASMRGETDDAPRAVCAHHVFERQVLKTPDAVAVRSDGRVYTYRELNERANQLAHCLMERGVGRHSIVGLYMERTADILVGMLGILKSGGAYLPLEPMHPPARIQSLLRESGTAIVVAEDELWDALEDTSGTEAILLDRDWTAIRHADIGNPDIASDPADLMYLLFTSGSTGKPKGVAVEHRNYMNYFEGVLKRLDLEPGLHFAIVSTFAADLGTTMIWPAFATGGTLHVIPYERAADPEAYAAYCRIHPIDVLKIVPSHFDVLFGVDYPQDIIPRHRLILAGEASHWQLIDRIRSLNPACTIYNHYGPTESTVSVLTYDIPERKPEGAKSTLPLGKPIPNVAAYVLNEAMQPVPVGVIGELYIGGASVTRGYYQRPDLTAERFLPDPFAPQPGGRMYRTGDLVICREDGVIHFVGRADDQVKIRGYRIEIGEVEHELNAYPLLQDSAVIVREDEPGNKRLVAYLVVADADKEAQTPFSIADLRKYLKTRLPDYMIPSALVLLDRLPLNANGKIDRHALPLPESVGTLQGEVYTAPRNELEQRLADAWAEVLGVEKVGIDDVFFDLGGDSFKTIKVVRLLGNTFSVMEMFKHQTIRELAEHLSSGTKAGEGLLVPFKPAQNVAGRKTKTVICVPYGGGSAITFQPLAQALPRYYAVYALQLPGHDFSKPDEPLASLSEVAKRCVEEIREKTEGEVILYGHCVGGAMVLRIAQEMERQNMKLDGIIMAATFPVARLPGKLFEWWHNIFPRHKWTSDKLFRDMLKAFGGFDDDVTPEEQRFVLRNLRHDTKEAEDYYTGLYANPSVPRLKSPIACIVGGADRMTEFYEERYLEWQHFSDQVDLHVIDQAGHYFHKHQADQLAHIIARQDLAWSREEQRDVAASREEARPESQTNRNQTVKPSVKAFLFVTLCMVISLVGTSFTGFALGISVYQETGSLQDYTMISLFAIIPAMLLLPLTGAIVDRYDRRKVILFSQCLTMVSSLYIGIMLYTDSLSLGVVYTAAALGSTAGAFFGPAYQAATAQLIPKRYLGNANGLGQMVMGLGGIMAPALGGALFVMIGLKNIIIIDIVSLTISIIGLTLIRFPNMLFKKREEPLHREIIGGWKYIINRKSLVAMVVFFIFVNFLMSMYNVLTAPFLLNFMTADSVGVTIALEGIGVLFGSLVMMIWGGFDRRATGMVGFVMLTGVSIAIVGIYPSFWSAAVGLFGFGVALAMMNAHWLSLIQSKVGLELQGRVLAINQLLAFSMRPLSFVLASPFVVLLFNPLAEMLPAGFPLFGDSSFKGMSLLIAVIGVIVLVWAALGMKYRTLRYMEDILPDAVPDSVVIQDKDRLQQLADRQLKQGA